MPAHSGIETQRGASLGSPAAAYVLGAAIDAAGLAFNSRPRRVVNDLGILCQEETPKGVIQSCTLSEQTGKVRVVLKVRYKSEPETIEGTWQEIWQFALSV